MDSVTVFSILIVRRAGSSMQAKSSNHNFHQKNILLMGCHISDQIEDILLSSGQRCVHCLHPIHVNPCMLM